METWQFNTSWKNKGKYYISIVCVEFSFTVKVDSAESLDIFQKVFPSSFAFEVLKVLNDPKTSDGNIIFTWRHWGDFDGVYRGTKGSGEQVEIYGLAKIVMGDEGVKKTEIFFNAQAFMEAIEGKKEERAGAFDFVGEAKTNGIERRIDKMNLECPRKRQN